MTIWRKSQTSAFCFSRINSALLWDWPVSSPSGPRPPTVLFQLGGGPHSCPEWRPTAKYRLVNLTSGLKCLRESVCFVLSHVPVQQKNKKKHTHCHQSWGAEGRVGRPASSRERLRGLWLLMTSATLFTLVKEQALLNKQKPTFSRRSSDAFVLSSDVPISTFPGRWAVRWWWTPTPFAGRRSAWPGNRPNCARLSRRSSERWLKGPGWVWGSASTSSGTADGTAPATTSISEKYCNKVSDDSVIPLCLFLYFSTGCNPDYLPPFRLQQFLPAGLPVYTNLLHSHKN